VFATTVLILMTVGRPISPAAMSSRAFRKRGIVEEALPDAEDDAGLVDRLEHRSGLGDRVGHRLLARDVLARARGRDDVVVVEVRGREDLDRVDLVVGEEGVEAGVDLGHVPLPRLPLGLFAAWVAQREDVAAIMLEVSGDVQWCDVAHADDPDAYAIHGSLRPLDAETLA
jgi:hypothetical protein